MLGSPLPPKMLLFFFSIFFFYYVRARSQLRELSRTVVSPLLHSPGLSLLSHQRRAVGLGVQAGKSPDIL